MKTLENRDEGTKLLELKAADHGKERMNFNPKSMHKGNWEMF